MKSVVILTVLLLAASCCERPAEPSPGPIDQSQYAQEWHMLLLDGSETTRQCNFITTSAPSPPGVIDVSGWKGEWRTQENLLWQVGNVKILTRLR